MDLSSILGVNSGNSGAPSIFDVQRRQALAQSLLQQTQPENSGFLGALGQFLSRAGSGYENSAAASEAQQGQTGATQALAKALGAGYPAIAQDPSALVTAQSNPFLTPGASTAANDWLQHQQQINTPIYEPGGLNGQPPSVFVAGAPQGQQVTPVVTNNGNASGTGSERPDPSSPEYRTQVAPNSGGLTWAALDQAALAEITSGVKPTGGRSGMTIMQATAINNRAAEMDPTGNLAANKAQVSSLTQSLGQQQKYADTVERAVTNAENGLSQLITAFQGKVNTSQYPTVNAALNATNAQFDPGTISAFKAGLTEVGNEYAQVFSRGGQVTDAVRARANAIANGDLSLPDLQQVLQELHAQGQIVVQGARDQVKKINDQISGIAQGQQSAPTGAPARANSDPLGILGP